MKLLMNLGNSDVRTSIEGSNEDYVFRTRDKFEDRIRNIIRALSGAKDTLQEDGSFQPALPVYDAEPKQNVLLTRISFPIIRQSIQGLGSSAESVEEIHCFLTKQNNPKVKQQDTKYLQDLLVCVGERLFPHIAFSFSTLEGNPSDFQEMLDQYRLFFQENTFTDTEIGVIIAQGTPAMCYGLSYACAERHPLVRQWYAAHKGNGTILKPLALFSKQTYRNAVLSFCKLHQQGEYKALETVVEESPILSAIPGIWDLCRYFQERSLYHFPKALEHLSALQESNPQLAEALQASSVGLDTIPSCIPEQSKGVPQLYYENENIPYLVYENLQNCLFEYNRDNIYHALGLFTAFLDILCATLVAQMIYPEPFVFDRQANGYPALDSFFESRMYPDIQTHGLEKEYKFIIDDWNNRKVIRFTGGAPMLVLKWFASQENSPAYIKDFSAFFTKYKGCQALKDLRNKSPIAHNMSGTSREKIDQTAKGSFRKLLEDAEHILWEMLPEGKQPSTSYHDTTEAIEKILLQYLKV